MTVSSAPHDPYAALRVPNYRAYLIGSFLSMLGRQAVSVAVTWEIYQWTHSATALGLVGLVNMLPLLALSLPAGALADRYDRRRIIALGTAVSAVLGIGLALLALALGIALPEVALRKGQGPAARRACRPRPPPPAHGARTAR
jgi:MFS family permease